MPSEHTPKRGQLFYGPGPYVEREIDEALFESLSAGEHALVFGPRGVGKSSLRVRTQARLREAGIRVATVDLGAIGAESRVDVFCASLLVEAGRSLGLAEEAKNAWRRSKGPPQLRLRAGLREVVLERSEAPLVLFIDELELCRALGPARDDVFAALRAMAEARGHEPIWARLSVCLIGALTRDELASDTRRGPFDLGARELAPRDFSREQLGAFAPVLDALEVDTEAVLDALYDWTSGHPALCQWIAGDLLLREVKRGEEASAVETVIRESFLQRGPELDPLLGDTARRLRRDQRDPWRTRMLGAYERVLRGERVDLRGRQLGSEGALIVARMRVAGLVAGDRGGKLRVRNKIIERAFDRNWVRRALAGRPISDALERWEASGRRPGQLLRGAALERARTWIEGRPDVTAGELDFVLASEQARTARLRRLTWVGGALCLSLGGLLGGALWQYQRVVDESLQATVDQAARRSELDGRRARDERAQAEEAKLEDKHKAGEGEGPTSFVGQTRQAVEQASGVALSLENEDLRSELGALSQRLAVEQAERAQLLAEDPRRRGEGLRLALAALEPWAGEPESAPASVTRALTANLASPGDSVLVQAYEGAGVELLALGRDRAVTVGHSGGDERGGRVLARVWSLTDGQRVAELESPAGILEHVAISPGGRRIAALSRAGALTTWDLSDNSVHGPAPILPPVGPSPARESLPAPVDSLRIDDGGAVKLLRRDGSVQLVDPAAGNSSALLSASSLAPGVAVEHVGVLEPTLTQAARVARVDGGALELWDPAAGRVVASVPAPVEAAAVGRVELLPGATRVLLQIEGGTALLAWTLERGAVEHVAEQDEVITALAVSADGQLIATGDEAGGLRLWSSAGEAVAALDGHAGPVSVLVFAGDALVSGDRNGELRVQALRVRDQPAPRQARLTPEGELSLAGREGPEGRTLWFGGRPDLPHMRLVIEDGLEVEEVAVDLGVTRVALRFADGRAALYDRAAVAKGRVGPKTPALLTLEGRVLDLELGAGGRLLASAGEDRRVALWDGAGLPIATLSGHEAPVDRLALSPDGARLVSADRSRELRVWEPGTAALIATLPAEHSAKWLAILADLVALVDAEGEAELWSISKRERLATASLGSAAIFALTVVTTERGEALLAVARPKAVELWRLDPEFGGEVIGRFRVHAARAVVPAASSEGQSGELLAVDELGTISRWPTEPARWLAMACGALPSGTLLPAACPIDG
ncbi:AAA-like domain-containing protein [Pseudenhygromyxa sp. WMMC2535]|uniref:AAA-like domain-containing protein n=1 Tax=Pseudenhygromyxa sp. WMMC2535 TaxID=2712867 RepID=UPI00155296B7|nr:AAA-like domain-containing protein [Pseudenhygromyxa sp. WMMC2535]NVB36317.1 AAA-like domain-containing protein [Pseudenhygromyxa sp. WMMC2535]